jgi:hypothetical protein
MLAIVPSRLTYADAMDRHKMYCLEVSDFVGQLLQRHSNPLKQKYKIFTVRHIVAVEYASER